MAAGVIPDPYLDGNEAALRWMYEIDWRYATVLDRRCPRSPAARAHGSGSILVFDGIDTVGTVRLGEGPDKIELGRTYNMHRSYRFDISHLPRSAGRSNSKLIFTQPPRTPKPNDSGSATGLGPTRRRTTSFARWPAALAGTGGLTYVRPVSGSRCGWSVGALRGWLK